MQTTSKYNRWKLLIGILIVGILIITGCGQKTEVVGKPKEETSNPAPEQVSIETKNATSNIEVGSLDDSELPYHRIVVDSPAIADFMSLYDVPLVGIPTTTKPMPEEYKGLPEIGIAVRPNIETIVSLNPDLFVGDKVLEQFNRQQIEDLGVKTVYLDNSSYDKVFQSVSELGDMLGREEVGEQFVAEQKALEADVLTLAEPLKGKKVALVMGTAESYQLATNQSYLGSILEKIGVENIAIEVGETNQEYVTFNKESLVASNPDFILALAHGGDPQQVKLSFEQEFAASIWDDTTAKRENRIHYIDSTNFPVTGTIRNVETMEKVVNLLLEGPTENENQK